jgi:uncharacterized membrane protein
MHKHGIIPALMILPLLFGSGCGSGEKSDTPTADSAGPAAGIQVISGFAVHGDETRTFRPCGEEQPLWAVDRSGLLWQLHKELALGREPFEELFAIIEAEPVSPPEDGFGADYPGALEVKRILYMAREGFRCNLDLAEFRWRTYGNEPFWAAWITADGIVLKVLGHEDRAWRDIAERTVEEGIVYTADDSTGSIEITIIDRPSRDSMSGAYFSHSAVIRTASEEFRGCALMGTGNPGNGR